MPVIAVVGANWGDEGKGKITDYLAREADFVIRYQGGTTPATRSSTSSGSSPSISCLREYFIRA